MSKKLSSVTIWSFALAACILSCSVSAESLYRETNYRGLVNDAKAQHIGDSITVEVFETSSAQTKNETDTSEETDLGLAASNGSNSEGVSLDTDSNYKSGGAVSRTGKLLARMTVTIHEILPTGELRIKGEQKIRINDEVQSITLSGNIRAIDIDGNNTVHSTRIANARIMYKGRGYTSDDTPGLLTEFFRWVF